MFLTKLLNEKDTYNIDDFNEVVSDEIKEKVASRVEYVLNYIDQYNEMDAVNVKMYIKDLIYREFNECLINDLFN